ncbi:hypothetical protein E2C01_080542 [Portunus trituberculatus]|uniref:Uncharacterized protein n=1 Tax=Portunus trituberculatus TaxID=210409 RepID=A0A5B7IPH8_PORTR|nr:hypothetical protein [Portunus trituberculatus]
MSEWWITAGVMKSCSTSQAEDAIKHSNRIKLEDYWKSRNEEMPGYEGKMRSKGRKELEEKGIDRKKIFNTN